MQFIYTALINDFDEKQIKDTAFEDCVFDADQTAVVENFAANKTEYVHRLSKLLKTDWEWKRLPYIDRAILLECLAESDVLKTPRSVLIDQAATTARHFGEEDSYKFVNGVLEKALPL